MIVPDRKLCFVGGSFETRLFFLETCISEGLSFFRKHIADRACGSLAQWQEVDVIGEPKKSFGKILYYNRKARNLTIKQLERKSGVSASFISRIENDSANPSVEVITKLARALGMPLSDFFHDQRGGKLLYPLRVSQARCLQDPKVLAFIDKLKALPPAERHAVLAMASQQINLLKSCLTPAGAGLYRLDPSLLEGDYEAGAGERSPE